MILPLIAAIAVLGKEVGDQSPLPICEGIPLHPAILGSTYSQTLSKFVVRILPERRTAAKSQARDEDQDQVHD